MMTFRRMANYVGAEPFRPFRINMASGEAVDIRHPEMIAVGRTTAHVFTWMNDDPKDREREISILLIESIEMLEPAARQDPSQN